MVEISGAVARRNLLQQLALAQRLGFESHHVHILRDRFQGMEVHVEIRGSQVFHRGEALSVLAALGQLLHQFGRHHLARLVVTGIVFQHFGFEGPVLVDL